MRCEGIFPVRSGLQLGVSERKKNAVSFDGGKLCFAFCNGIPEFPGGFLKILPESPVEGGVVVVTDLLAYRFQGNTLTDQFLSQDHTAHGHEAMECHIALVLEHLGHGGHADTAVGSDSLQSQLFLQMLIHKGSDLEHHVLFLQTGTGAFLTALCNLFRKGFLLHMKMWTAKASVNRPVNGKLTKS